MSGRVSLALGWSVLIVGALLLPTQWLSAPERVHGHLDKVVHAGFFAGFGFFWMRAGRSWMRAVCILAGGVVLAALTELGQAVPIIGRDADSLDAIADVVGALLGIGTHYAVSRPTRLLRITAHWLMVVVAIAGVERWALSWGEPIAVLAVMGLPPLIGAWRLGRRRRGQSFSYLVGAYRGGVVHAALIGVFAAGGRALGWSVLSRGHHYALAHYTDDTFSFMALAGFIGICVGLVMEGIALLTRLVRKRVKHVRAALRHWLPFPPDPPPPE